MKVTAIIEKSESGMYSVYVPDKLPGCFLNGQGFNVEEAKQEMFDTLEEIKEYQKEVTGSVPDELNNLEFEYQYDVSSFFDYFKEFNVSALARRVGINASLMRRYRNRSAFASTTQLKKIEEALKNIGQELCSARF